MREFKFNLICMQDGNAELCKLVMVQKLCKILLNYILNLQKNILKYFCWIYLDFSFTCRPSALLSWIFSRNARNYTCVYLFIFVSYFLGKRDDMFYFFNVLDMCGVNFWWVKGEVLIMEVAWSYYGAIGVEATRNNDVLGVLIEYDIDSNALRAGIVELVDPSVHFFLWEILGSKKKRSDWKKKQRKKWCLIFLRLFAHKQWAPA